MPYPKRRLHDGERIVLDTHPHPLFFFGPVVLLCIAIVAGVVSLTSLEGTPQRAANNLTIALIALGLVWLVGRYVRWRNTFFVVTTRRVVSQSGVFSRNGIEIPMERVNTVSYHQSLIARLAGVGDIEIESGGEDGKQHFPDIRDPGAVKNVIASQIQENRRGRADADPGTPVVDVTTQLERLEALLERGRLTPEEFELQKQRLLADPYP